MPSDPEKQKRFEKVACGRGLFLFLSFTAFYYATKNREVGEDHPAIEALVSSSRILVHNVIL